MKRGFNTPKTSLNWLISSSSFGSKISSHDWEKKQREIEGQWEREREWSEGGLVLPWWELRGTSRGGCAERRRRREKATRFGRKERRSEGECKPKLCVAWLRTRLAVSQSLPFFWILRLTLSLSHSLCVCTVSECWEK